MAIRAFRPNMVTVARGLRLEPEWKRLCEDVL